MELSGPANMMMRQIVLLVMLAATTGAVWAEATTLWVRDRIVVSLRDAPGKEGKVLRTIATGAEVKLLERSSNGAYAKVALKNGTEGWVAARYLVDEPIAAIRLAKMETEWKRFKEENERLRKELEDLQSLSKDPDALRRLKSENERLTAEIRRFEEINTEPLALANENEALRNKNVALEKELQMVRQELQVAKDRSDRDWFLLGAGVLIAGILVGIVLPRLRVRKRNSWEL